MGVTSANDENHSDGEFQSRQSSARVHPVVLPILKPDKLSERISSLSNPRDYVTERTPVGLFDSLPPEGYNYPGISSNNLVQSK